MVVRPNSHLTANVAMLFCRLCNCWSMNYICKHFCNGPSFIIKDEVLFWGIGIL